MYRSNNQVKRKKQKQRKQKAESISKPIQSFKFAAPNYTTMVNVAHIHRQSSKALIKQGSIKGLTGDTSFKGLHGQTSRLKLSGAVSPSNRNLQPQGSSHILTDNLLEMVTDYEKLD
mmetsp:Transcript_6778/g.10904  ORF Transcript_6778/g.10904 Transcript_6778/m.10904 type:complete len:117 (+) Transcript_6778:1249-1599(+)